MSCDIVVIGGGIAGLTAAYHYAKQGNSVVVYEASNRLGGLLQTDRISLPGVPEFHIEYFYHHFFETDSALVWLLDQLGISDYLHMLKVNNSFNALTLRDKLALGVLLLYPTYWGLGRIRIADYLKLWRIHRSSDSFLYRLVRAKFGKYSNNINLAWLWARLHARFTLVSILRGERLGVIVPSSKVLLDALIENLRLLNVRFITATPVTDIHVVLAEHTPKRVVITTPVHIAKEIVASALKWKWSVPDYLGAVNVVFFMAPNEYSYPFYWTNLDFKEGEPPFLVRVEQSLLNKSLPVRVVYFGMYLDQSSEYWKWQDKELVSYLERRFQCLRKGRLGVKVYRTRFAQHIPTVEYIKNIPPRVLGVVDSGDSSVIIELFSFGNIYPWDRGINYAVYTHV